MLGKQKNELKAAKTQIELDNENLETRVSFLQQAANKAAADMEVYRSHDYKKVMLMPVASSSHEMACVYWNPVTHKLFVDNCGLANPGEGKTYQLWAMKNGKPVSVGLFKQEMYNQGLQEFASVDLPESFAVTIENKDGASEPTLSALQVAGKI
jgi:anti-sigma-K factor RskA